MNNPSQLILASSSAIRQELLRNASVPFEVKVARIDEDSIKSALIAEGETPRNIADALAEGKARKISMKFPEALTLGCDQVLNFKGKLLSKSRSKQEAKEALLEMKGQRHKLFSAAVIYEGGEPVWRAVTEANLYMGQFSEAYLDDYLERNWEMVQHCVGNYMLESEGVRLFSKIDGDYFTILGMPLLQILDYLKVRGLIST